MPDQEKLRRGRTYGLLLDNWVLGRDRSGEPDSLTLLFDRLVADGRHLVVEQPGEAPQRKEAS